MRTHSGRPVVHLELRTKSPPVVCAFYSLLFGWRPEITSLGSSSYLTLGWGERLEIGVVEHDTAYDLWLPYVEVADVREATERACGLGANVALPPREGPAGWRSVLGVPTGAQIGLWQPKR